MIPLTERPDPIMPAAELRTLEAAGPKSPRTVWQQLLRSPTFLVGAVIALFWIVCAIFGNSIAPNSPLYEQLLNVNAHPSGAHLFGTDYLGRDVLARVIVGAHNILIIAPVATLLGTVIGTVLGLVMGYFGGAVDAIVGRIVEALLALPLIIVAVLFVLALGPSVPTLVVVIGFVFAPLIARTVRSAVLGERELDYVAAARLRGDSAVHIMFAEILPNVLSPILVEFTVRIGYAIFTVATLSFLGLGPPPPTPDWGADISNTYTYLSPGYWWEPLFPALAIASLVIAVNLIADSVESVLAQ
jgi:peptide/nickel transport system permease protein